jgi:putative ABC transport system substrate-binding protein
MNKIKYFLFLTAVILLCIIPESCNNKTKDNYAIGIINIIPDFDEGINGFKTGMTEQGYIEGKNIQYIYNGATTDISRLEEAVQIIIDEKPDIILSFSTPSTLIVKQETANNGIPVIFSMVTDPVGSGIIDSLQKPEGNITGVTIGFQEALRFEWLIKLAPDTQYVYIPYNPNDKSPVLALETAKSTAAKLGIELITREAYDPDTLENAVMNIPEQADAVFLLPDSFVATRLTDITAEAIKRKLPISGANTSIVRDLRMLTSYGLDLFATGKQTARLAVQIFKGVKPSDLPVELPEFQLAVNLRTAEEIGLSIPEEILRQADIIVR